MYLQQMLRLRIIACNTVKMAIEGDSDDAAAYDDNNMYIAVPLLGHNFRGLARANDLSVNISSLT